MRPFLSLAFAALLALLSTSPPAAAAAEPSARTLPILFLHGYASNAAVAAGLQKNLSTDARPFVALTACENECSTRPLREQLDLAIAQIREITASDKRFDDGYVLIGHSQGGALIRGIATEMDDHKIHTLVSVAGGSNGLFYGPQASDALPARGFLDVLAPIMTKKELFDYTAYTDADIQSGKMVADWVKLHIAHPELQATGAGYNLYRSPVTSKWIEYNPFFPVVGNLQDATTDAALAKDQQRRKQNFLRLREAHFYGSPVDAGVSPWQSALLGAYETVESVEALERDFRKLRVLPMKETPEYTRDSYGLATLDKRGALFLHEVPDVSHGCWLLDEVPYGGTVECKFQPVFEKTLYALLGPAPKGKPGCK